MSDNYYYGPASGQHQAGCSRDRGVPPYNDGGEKRGYRSERGYPPENAPYSERYPAGRG